MATPDGVKEKEITYYKNSIGMEFVLVRAGEFMMGSPQNEERRDDHEGPQHRVKITKPFYMAATEVTQEQYEKIMGKNPAHFKGDTKPVEHVSWNDATEFCRKLSGQEEGLSYRLPTEAEWEYACRAGTRTPFYTGETVSTDQANYDGRSTYGSGRKGVHLAQTTPVATFPANPWGLYNMHGNVCEWCQDWYDKAYYEKSPAEDPPGPTEGTLRVLRGGSWPCLPLGCRSAFRLWGLPTYAFFHLSGFRVVLSPQ